MKLDPPPTGTPERAAWEAGAWAEHDLAVEGMTESGREVYDAVQVLAQQGRSAEEIARWVHRVWTPPWTTRAKWAARYIGRQLAGALEDVWEAAKPLLPAMGVLAGVAVVFVAGVLVGEYVL